MQHIQADVNYLKLQEKGKKPGLWNIRSSSSEPEFLQSGKLDKNSKNRFVVIADRGSNEIDIVADKSYGSLTSLNSTVERLVSNEGFNLHFTPGKNGIGGLKNASEALGAEHSASLRESALLLANTMYHARGTEGVMWFSNRGGSGVLTQAMQILSDQNIKLEKHAVFMNKPTTQPSKVLQLATKTGLKLEGKGRSSGFHPDELMGHLVFLDDAASKFHRLKHDDDYTALKLTGDIARGGVQAASLGLGGIGLGAAIGIGGTLAAAPAVGAGGALLFLMGVASSVTKNLAPKTYNKIKNKFE